jgi:hypothetical protein
MMYRKGTELVDAFHWTGNDESDPAPLWIVAALESDLVRLESHGPNASLLVGAQRAWSGSYIVKDAAGELSVWSPQDFERFFVPA